MRRRDLAVAALVSLGLVTLPSEAASADLPTTIPLDRPAVLLSNAMPGYLACRYDEDDNGLDDDIEQQIAQAFVPQLRFDAAEDATSDDEPHAVYNTRLTLDESGRLVLTIKYVFVWHYDGGFVVDSTCQNALWGDAHAGDTQPMTATVMLGHGTDRWYAVLWSLSGFVSGAESNFDWGPTMPDVMLMHDGTHPVVFPSAGKHHVYWSAGEHTYPAEVANCTDNAFGNGIVVIPTVEHVPHGTYSDNVPPAWARAHIDPYFDCQNPPVRVCVDDPVAFEAAFPYIDCVDGQGQPAGWAAVQAEYCTDYPEWVLADGRRRFVNACTLRRAGAKVAATQSLRPLDLTDWGYPISNGYSPSFLSHFFRDEETSGIYTSFPTTPEDVDGDGFARWEDPCPTLADPALASDADGDGIGDQCDPEPQFQSVYVAGGSDADLAVPISSYVGAGTGPFRWEPWQRGGFADADQDGYPDGEDLCPFNVGNAENSNAWGEELSWSPLENVSGTRHDKLGVFYRGDTCDPYPLAEPTWNVDRWTPTGSTACIKPGWRTKGASSAQISHHAGQGVSNNDALVVQPNLSSLPPTSYWTQTFRCACDGFTGADCVENIQSPCYRNNVVGQTSHAEPTWGRGWRAIDHVGCVDGDRDTFGYCHPYSLAVPYLGLQDGHLSGNTPEVEWNWLDELLRDQTDPPGDRHFADQDFSYVPATGDGLSLVGDHYVSANRYVLWTWVGVDDAYQAPGPKHSPPNAYHALPDPEALDVDGLTPSQGPNSSAKSRRLRSAFDSSGQSLTSAYSYFDAHLYNCPAFNLKYLAHVRWPEEIIRWSGHAWRAPSDMILASNGSMWSDSFLLRGDSRQLATLVLSEQSADSWVGTDAGLTAALTATNARAVSGAASDDSSIPSTTSGQGLSVLPELVRVQTGTELARWALLVPIDFDGQTVAYTSTADGELPIGVHESARLVKDDLGSFTALVDPASGAVLGFDPVLSDWVRADVPADALPELASANLALVGPALFVVGSRPDESQRAPAWVIDILGRAPRSVPLNFPARVRAELTLSTDRRSLLLFGGKDTSLQAHDDVWAASIPAGNRAWSSATRIRPDTGNASVVSPSTTVVAGSSDGEELRAWSVTTDDGAGIITPLERTDRGWLALNDQGQPVADSCPQTDPLGGQLCKLDGAWWATAGVKACSDAVEPGRCLGSPGELVSELSLNLQRVVVDVATDGVSVWVLTRGSLHRFVSDGAGHLRETASTQLQGAGMALAVSASQVLVGTDKGVHLVQVRSGSLFVSSANELCGRPLRMAFVAPSLWAVSTTLGTALVSTAKDGPPTTLSMSIVLPTAGAVGEVYPLATDTAGLSVCRSVDRLLNDGAVAAVSTYSPLAATGNHRLLVVRGAFVVAVDVTHPENPVAVHAETVNTPLMQLRVDAIGLRAYGVGSGPAPRRYPVLHLRDAGFELSGQHNIPTWVGRQDAGRWTVQVQGSHVVKVAEVLR